MEDAGAEETQGVASSLVCEYLRAHGLGDVAAAVERELAPVGATADLRSRKLDKLRRAPGSKGAPSVLDMIVRARNGPPLRRGCRCRLFSGSKPTLPLASLTRRRPRLRTAVACPTATPPPRIRRARPTCPSKGRHARARAGPRTTSPSCATCAATTRPLWRKTRGGRQFPPLSAPSTARRTATPSTRPCARLATWWRRQRVPPRHKRPRPRHLGSPSRPSPPRRLLRLLHPRRHRARPPRLPLQCPARTRPCPAGALCPWRHRALPAPRSWSSRSAGRAVTRRAVWSWSPALRPGPTGPSPAAEGAGAVRTTRAAPPLRGATSQRRQRQRRRWRRRRTVQLRASRPQSPSKWRGADYQRPGGVTRLADQAPAERRRRRGTAAATCCWRTWQRPRRARPALQQRRRGDQEGCSLSARAPAAGRAARPHQQRTPRSPKEVRLPA